MRWQLVTHICTRRRRRKQGSSIVVGGGPQTVAMEVGEVQGEWGRCRGRWGEGVEREHRW